jgi:phosphate transport system permease protein
MLGRRRSIAIAGGYGAIRSLHSLPKYYGYYVAIWCGIPGLLLMALWLSVSEPLIVGQVVASLPEELRSLPDAERSLVVNDIKNMAAGQFVNPKSGAEITVAADLYKRLQASARWILSGLIVAVGLLGWGVAWSRLRPELRARNQVEAVIKIGLICASMVAILTTVGILLSVLYEAVLFFQKIPITDFLFGLTWSPQTALRADQVGSSGAFGAIPLFTGTLLISAIAMLVAMPIGLMTAIFLSEYATLGMRAWIKPALEILAGVPTVVYGYFAALTVGPLLVDLGDNLGLDVASESALGAGLVMGIMIIPFVSSLSDDVINAVPQAMRDGSYALGATQSETIKHVVLPAALPGIVGGALLAVSRAIGETMIVVMAAGLAANLTANPLEAVTTVTVQIVTLLVGDQEFDSAKTLAAFALGLVLFIVTLALNVIALRVVRKYREQYE